MAATRDISVSVQRKFWFTDEKTRERRCAYGRGWPKHAAPARAEVMTLHEAATRRFPYPAYLVAYKPTPHRLHRITHEVLTKDGALAEIGGSIRMQLFALDVDVPGHAHEGVDEWFDSQRPKVMALLEAHPGLWCYRSLGGYRLLGALPEDFEILDAQSSRAWARKVVSWIAYLNRRFGLSSGAKPDQLVDWGRLQRVPHDRRTEEGAIAELEFIGDPECIGIWEPMLDASDLAAGEAYKPDKVPHPGPNSKRDEATDVPSADADSVPSAKSKPTAKSGNQRDSRSQPEPRKSPAR